MNFLSRKAIVVTHNGGFHPDDVFAVATLSLLLKGKITIVRTRDPKVISGGDYVVDVGNVYDFSHNRFDHHQPGTRLPAVPFMAQTGTNADCTLTDAEAGAGKRPNGVPYAAFGLVWKHYGEAVAGGKESAEMIDNSLVQFVDSFDNGVGEIKPVVGAVLPFTIGDIVENMNPTGKSNPTDFDRAFRRGVSMAVQIIMDAISVAKEKIISRAAVESAYHKVSDKRIIILDGIYSWRDILNKYPEPLFVVEPDYKNKNGEINWQLRCVRDNPNNFVNRKDLPAEWAGKRIKELADVTGVSDAVFCHNKRFMAVARSKEGAIKLAERALGDNRY